MLYTLLNNDRIVIGPREWHQTFFQHFVDQELRTTGSILPESAPSESIIFSDSLKLVQTQVIQPESLDNSFEQLAGPRLYFDESNNHIAEFYAQEFSIETIKTNLKQQVADIRWTKETTPITRDINGKWLTLYADRETRSVYAQALLLTPDNYSGEWKFPEGFCTINKADLQQIASEIIAYVQSCFDWESKKIAEIDVIQTSDELRVYNLEN